MRGQFLVDRIAKTKTLIEAYEGAIDAIALGAVQSYTLDTGQSRQTVTKFDLKRLNGTLDSLYNRLAVLETRANGRGTIHGRPAW